MMIEVVGTRQEGHPRQT